MVALLFKWQVEAKGRAAFVVVFRSDGPIMGIYDRFANPKAEAAGAIGVFLRGNSEDVFE